MNDTISSTTVTFIVLLVIWEFAWKGMALWKAARLQDKGWSIALLCINTAGLLPIAYLLLNKRSSE